MNDKSVLITGATGGMGTAVAHRLINESKRMIIVGTNLPKLRALSKQLGKKCEFKAVDFRSLAEIQTMLNECGDIDQLVHCAGIGFAGKTLDVGIQELSDTIDVNCKASLLINYYYANSMKKRGRGTIVNVSSLAGSLPVAQFNTYAATKAFLTSFSETLSWELRGSGVRVETYCPGGVTTQFHTKAGLLPGIIQDQKQFLSSPEEAANDIIKLLKYGNGPVIPGIMNKLMYLASRILPKKTLLKSSDIFYTKYIQARN